MRDATELMVQYAAYHRDKRNIASHFIGITGPMFVTAEAMFALGWGKSLLADIEQRVGPTRIRDLTQSAA